MIARILIAALVAAVVTMGSPPEAVAANKPASKAGIGAPVLVDSYGDVVGVLMSHSPTEIGVAGDNGQKVLIKYEWSPSNGQIELGGYEPLIYDNPTCTPPAYMSPFVPGIRLLWFGAVRDGVVYGPDLDAVPQQVYFDHMYRISNGGCIDFPGIKGYYPAVPAVELKYFGPPLTRWFGNRSIRRKIGELKPSFSLLRGNCARAGLGPQLAILGLDNHARMTTGSGR